MIHNARNKDFDQDQNGIVKLKVFYFWGPITKTTVLYIWGLTWFR